MEWPDESLDISIAADRYEGENCSAGISLYPKFTVIDIAKFEEFSKR